MALAPPKRRVSDAENKLRLLCCIDALGAVTPAQLWPFVASLELMEYIPMQLLLHELISGGDVGMGAGALREHLLLTRQGHSSFQLFYRHIMASDRRQIREAAAAYRAELQRRARAHTAYELAQGGNYRVRLTLQEGELPLLVLRLATESRECAAGAIGHFEGAAAQILKHLYSLETYWGEDGKEGPPAADSESEGATLQSHSRFEHTVTAVLPHTQAKITLALLLPDEHTARAYKRTLSQKAVAEETARRLMTLLCTEGGSLNS
ncbi:MAG: DUF4364 family protein [Clostridia bacterium]|nr:DUF4364 family protein [Clostridia bacterium]